MGPNTGLVLGYETRNKRCCQCEVSTRTGVEKLHDCRKNYSGSSKGMEGDVAVSLFRKSAASNNKYSTLIGDDDSTTIAWLHSEVDSDIEKLSDVNHAKSNLHKQLNAVKSKHKELTQKVIQYIKKCFSYAVAQNPDNPIGLQVALNATPLHMFGDHSRCDIAWCGYIQRLGPNLPGTLPYKHSSLRAGTDLMSLELKSDLIKILGRFATNSRKLAAEGCSQRNESLNSTIISKTTKARHYGGSAQNDYWVSAGVAQKNLNYTYVPKVMDKLNISPWLHTSVHATRMSNVRERERARSQLPSCKRRRLIRKSERTGKGQADEVLEGVSYQIGVGYEETPDITQIPEAKFRPELLNPSDVDTAQIIVFDIKTANAGKHTLI